MLRVMDHTFKRVAPEVDLLVSEPCWKPTCWLLVSATPSEERVQLEVRALDAVARLRHGRGHAGKGTTERRWKPATVEGRRWWMSGVVEVDGREGGRPRDDGAS